jgi:hypothetical protein
MEIRRYTYADVHFNADEQEKANKIRKQLERRGYILWVEDAGGKDGDGIGHDYVDQYLKQHRSRQL